MEDKQKIKLLGIALFILGFVVGGLCLDIWNQQTINELRESKIKLVLAPTPIEDLDFQIVSHDHRLLFIDEEAQYWNDNYFIRVFRVGDTYYIKIYTFAEINGD